MSDTAIRFYRPAGRRKLEVVIHVPEVAHRPRLREIMTDLLTRGVVDARTLREPNPLSSYALDRIESGETSPWDVAQLLLARWREIVRNAEKAARHKQRGGQAASRKRQEKN